MNKGHFGLKSYCYGANHREDSAFIPGLKTGDFPLRHLRSCKLKSS
jgi:hypothetical protein